MPRTVRGSWHERLRAVEREWVAAGLAVAAFARELAAGRVALPHPLTAKDVAALAGNLSATYLIRLFAEFEAGLRSYWDTLGRDTQPPATDLLNGVAARQRVPDNVLAAAHAVREARNRLVHQSTASALTLADARQRLQQFLSRLPDDW